MFSCLKIEHETPFQPGGSEALSPRLNVWAEYLQDVNKLYRPRGALLEDEGKAKLPNKKYRTYDDYSEGATFFCVEEEETNYTNFSSGCSSTYPIDIKKEARAKAHGQEFNGERLGDPICDYYGVNFVEDHINFCIADGCNWGARPRDAAVTACKSFIQYMIDDNVLPEVKDTKSAVTQLVRAFSVCQKSVVKATTGTSTLLGGLVLRTLDEPEPKTLGESSPPPQEVRGRYNFVCLSLGDCKVFRFNKKRNVIQEITERSRPNESDMSDPGGRLGFATKEGDADLRNLTVFTQGLEEGDLIIALTDGVYDNFDPEFLGMKPDDLGQSEGMDWKDLDKQQCHDIKLEYRNKLIMETVCEDGKKIQVSRVTEKLIRHCKATTQASRDWVREHPDSRMPSDKTRFKGKMDHCTVLCFVVGERLGEKEELKKKGKKKKKKAKHEDAEGKDKEKHSESEEEEED